MENIEDMQVGCEMNLSKEDIETLKFYIFYAKDLTKSQRKELQALYDKVHVIILEQHTDSEWRVLDLALKVTNYILTVY